MTPVAMLQDEQQLTFLKVAVFWNPGPYSLVETDRRFKGAYCRHHQDNNRSISTKVQIRTSQKTAKFIFFAV